MSTTVKDLGLIQGILPGLTAPTNIMQLWYDTNTGVNALKYYDVSSSSWVLLSIQNYVKSPVQLLSDLNSISGGTFSTSEDLHIRLVHENGSLYFFDKNSTQSSLPPYVFVTADNVGRYVRVGYPVILNDFEIIRSIDGSQIFKVQYDNNGERVVTPLT